jgi:hypothetical protein
MPDFILKGKEHEKSFNIEDLLLKEYGGKLVFSSGEVVFSSYDLIKKSLENSERVKFEVPNNFLQRHSISKSTISNLIRKFTKLNILVIGDLIVDEYITCEPLGMSQEDPTIVVKPIDSKKYIGGAGIVAAHASSLGARVKFITITGDDSIKDYALTELANFGVDSKIFIDETRPTTLKQRFRTKGKTLLRISHLHQAKISADLQKKILTKFKNLIKTKLLNLLLKVC